MSLQRSHGSPSTPPRRTNQYKENLSRTAPHPLRNQCYPPPSPTPFSTSSEVASSRSTWSNGDTCPTTPSPRLLPGAILHKTPHHTQQDHVRRRVASELNPGALSFIPKNASPGPMAPCDSSHLLSPWRLAPGNTPSSFETFTERDPLADDFEDLSTFIAAGSTEDPVLVNKLMDVRGSFHDQVSGRLEKVKFPPIIKKGKGASRHAREKAQRRKRTRSFEYSTPENPPATSTLGAFAIPPLPPTLPAEWSR